VLFHLSYPPVPEKLRGYVRAVNCPNGTVPVLCPWTPASPLGGPLGSQCGTDRTL